MFNYEKYLQQYNFTSILPGSKKEITYRPLTTNDLKKILIYENQDDPLLGENILDQIVTDVVLDEEFNVDNLYLQDRYFLFIEIRKATRGSIHTFPHTCDKCGNQSIQKIDLDNLEIKELDIENVNTKIELLGGNITLDMEFLTRGKQKESHTQIGKKLTTTQKQVDMVIGEIAASIKSITTPDGTEEVPIKEKMKLIGDLPGGEYDKIKQWYEDNYFGIDLNIDVNCPHCGEKETRQMPMNNFFE